MYRFHLIGNAHLDPVWLWDWKEGFNEAINTSRTMLELLDDYPELTLVRGESALYEFIEREAPELFTRIVAHVRAGRWEPVGGTYVQSDNNLPGTVTLLQQFVCGQAYFRKKFGGETDTAWFPDSFGHSAGMPEILAASGIKNFAHCRPFAANLPLAESAYWWIGRGGSRILAYRSPVDWYCHERHSLPARLDAYLAAAQKGRLRNLAVFYGLGNHGGGPTRRMLDELHDWTRAHPEVEVIHSGLSRYFSAVRNELAERSDLVLPEIRGELNFCLRGCYAATARIKHAFRRTEHQLLRAGRVLALATARSTDFEPPSLDLPWRAVLFNSFHDILPGSSIERVYDDQIAHLGGAFHAAQVAEFAGLNAIARDLDTTVPKMAGDAPTAVPILVLNPHEIAYRGPIEFEAQLDWRPIAGYQGEAVERVPIEVLDAAGDPILFQRVRVENRSMTDLVWRVRLVVSRDLPPGGWEILTVQYKEQPRLAEPSESRPRAKGDIANEFYALRTSRGGNGLMIERDRQALFGGEGLQVWLYDDPYGCWGGMHEEPESFQLRDIREKFVVTETRILEDGPQLVRAWVRFSGVRSRVDLTITLQAGREAIDFDGRLFLADRSCRMKLVLPGVYEAVRYEVPGGAVDRSATGEVPGIGWIWAHGEDESLGFASDVLSGFCRTPEGAVEVTLARASRYADDLPTSAEDEPHLPANDCGELRFRAVVSSEFEAMPRLGRFLHQPPIVQSVPARAGKGSRRGEGFGISAGVEVLAVRPHGSDRLDFTLHRTAASPAPSALSWGRRELPINVLREGQIGEVRLVRSGDSWTTERGGIKS